MNFRKGVILNLPEAKGEVKVVFSPMSFNVYQNGKKIKKKGGIKAKFPVETTTGEIEPIVIRNGKGMVRTAHFKDQQIPLEERLSGLERFIAIGSVIFAFIVGCALFGFITGVIGGALIGFTVAMAVMFSLAFIRQEKNLVLQILVSVGLSAVAYLVYFLLGMLIVSALHGAVMPMVLLAGRACNIINKLRKQHIKKYRHFDRREESADAKALGDSSLRSK
ncbi:MAG: hypothetical protein LBG19_12650 [Prevotellaceae bacterium]|jgi:hypothetical protein|nr:hypothetical protein [Prevotellaceae bacterium]